MDKQGKLRTHSQMVADGDLVFDAARMTWVAPAREHPPVRRGLGIVSDEAVMARARAAAASGERLRRFMLRDKAGVLRRYRNTPRPIIWEWVRAWASETQRGTTITPSTARVRAAYAGLMGYWPAYTVDAHAVGSNTRVTCPLDLACVLDCGLYEWRAEANREEAAL